MKTGRQMCVEIMHFLHPEGAEDSIEWGAHELWLSFPNGSLDRLASLYEYVRVQRMLRGEAEQDELPGEPRVGDTALRAFPLPDRRVVRRMTFTGSFWMRTAEWTSET